MIDNDNLRTASLYINNQLLSRGLLRDGDSIDFAGTRRSDEEDAAVSGRIISILNDLILRRDRDAEQRESLSMSMRSLRAENLKLTADVARLHDKHTEAQRKADLATAAESSLRTQLKSAEANARALKEDVARMKSLVAQSRSSCATEIRRRDRQIDTLKKQLGEAGRSRGTRGNPAITTITVTGDVGGNNRDTMSTTMSLMSNDGMSNDDGDSITSNNNNSPVQYDSTLRRETNATLSNLAQLLTEENDTMLGVLQQTMAQLRDMSGWVADTREDELVRKRPTCEDMAAELDSVMDHMRVILTNPSFVPIEEVMTREDEIIRLKRGWVQMENRWKEAVHLMDGWRKRMAVSGKPVCDEDLQMGMRLSPVRVSGMDDDGTHYIADHGLSVVKEESEEENAHEYHLDSPCRAGNAVGRPDYAAGEERKDDEEVEMDHVAGSSDSDSDVGAVHHEGGLSEDEGAAADGDSHESSHQSPQEGSSPEDEDEEEPLESSIPPPQRPQLGPLRNSTSAGNRGVLKVEKLRLRSRPQPTSDCGANGDQSTRQARETSKSMRSMPVRPRGPSSQFSRLPSKVQRPVVVERPRSPSRSSLDEALLSPRGADDKRSSSSSAPQPPNEESVQESVAAAKMHEPEPDAHTSTTTSSRPSHSPIRVDSRTRKPPLRSTGPNPAQSPLTMSNIAAKLAASEKEANAARVRAKLKAARGSTRGVSRPPMVTTTSAAATTSAREASPAPPLLSATTGEEAQAAAAAPHGQDIPDEHPPMQKQTQTGDPSAQPEKRKRDRKASKAASRRRSTLSPWELQTLISGEAQ
ncbi:hypothetical protein E4U55_001388 [Claviceps digitariae]|nr:hypothetical protein E4U55_001388 [Claviceps digitariae]